MNWIPIQYYAILSYFIISLVVHSVILQTPFIVSQSLKSGIFTQAAAEAIADEHGRLDLLINTAGILHVSDLNIHPGANLFTIVISLDKIEP